MTHSVGGAPSAATVTRATPESSRAQPKLQYPAKTVAPPRGFAKFANGAVRRLSISTRLAIAASFETSAFSRATGAGKGGAPASRKTRSGNGVSGRGNTPSGDTLPREIPRRRASRYFRGSVWPLISEV